MRLSLKLLCLLAIAGPAGAGNPPKPSDPAVTLSLRAMPLREALDTTFRESGVVWIVERNVPDVPVTATLRGVSREAAARALVRSASARVPGLSLIREGAGFRIAVRTAGTEQSQPAAADVPPANLYKRITVHLPNVPLRRAAERLFMKVGIKYRVEPTVPDVPVNVNLRNAPFHAALVQLVGSAADVEPNIAVGRVQDTFVISTNRNIFEGQQILGNEIIKVPGQQDQYLAKLVLKNNSAYVVAPMLGGEVLMTEADLWNSVIYGRQPLGGPNGSISMMFNRPRPTASIGYGEPGGF